MTDSFYRKVGKIVAKGKSKYHLVGFVWWVDKLWANIVVFSAIRVAPFSTWTAIRLELCHGEKVAANQAGLVCTQKSVVPLIGSTSKFVSSLIILQHPAKTFIILRMIQRRTPLSSRKPLTPNMALVSWNATKMSSMWTSLLQRMQTGTKRSEDVLHALYLPQFWLTHILVLIILNFHHQS